MLTEEEFDDVGYTTGCKTFDEYVDYKINSREEFYEQGYE